jgi:hypothetical protein
MLMVMLMLMVSLYYFNNGNDQNYLSLNGKSCKIFFTAFLMLFYLQLKINAYLSLMLKKYETYLLHPLLFKHVGKKQNRFTRLVNTKTL